jgi:membrane-associated protease RseP (regulator of RpoE activity)
MMNENREVGTRAENAGTINCPSCGATLVAGLRFCRMCGYRLGEGVEEYVATQRLDPNAPRVAATSAATDPFAARATWGHAPLQPNNTTALGQQPDAYLSPRPWRFACRPVRGNWMIWMIVMIVLMGSGALPFTFGSRGGGGSGTHKNNAPATSLMGEADAYDDAEGGGAFIRGLAGPDSSLERAGLVGGDIIKSFDGKPVNSGDDMERFIADTPVGKAISVVYVHDGETKSTMLTTAASGMFHGMDLIKQRPGGRGVLDVDFGDGDRVRLPDSNIYGVKLTGVERNGPADIAGLKKGDIVIKFDEQPIRTAGDLRYRAGAATPGSTVNVVVMRDGQQLTIPVKMGRQK